MYLLFSNQKAQIISMPFDRRPTPEGVGKQEKVISCR